MIENNRQAVSCVGCHYELNDVAFCQTILQHLFRGLNAVTKLQQCHPNWHKLAIEIYDLTASCRTWRAML